MLENSYGLNFFLKTPEKKSEMNRFVYVRITVDGIPKETSTKRKWDARRWDQKLERAAGTKEDAKSLNFFLDSLVTRINNYKTDLTQAEQTITAKCIIDFVKGKTVSKAKVLEEFQKHNEEMFELVPKEYSKATHTRYVTARSHVHQYIRFKFKKEDIEFRELNYEFIIDYEFYLKTVKQCSHNTTLKYISNFKKIVLRAVAKEIIPKDPFVLFKRKKERNKKKPLSKTELYALENKQLNTERLSVIRDIFVFQCYTGLAYIDARQLRRQDIKEGDDGRLWIMSSRQKSKSTTDIPLLPKALEIMDKYKNDPVCKSKGAVLPVKSNQKMNEYLKEIATLCNINTTLTTHVARRTFASTVTLNNGVPIHVVKEMLGHYSVKQTEEYAITENEAVSKEMMQLKERLSISAEQKNNTAINQDRLMLLQNLQKELDDLKNGRQVISPENFDQKIVLFQEQLNQLKSATG